MIIETILAAAVLIPMAALAAVDGRHAIVDPRLVLVLLAAAAAWRILGAGAGTSRMSWLGAGAGLALGAGAAAVPIAVAHWRRRRWPLYPGDAMMLGAFGFLLGPLGLAWTMLLGSAFALLHRLCLQRRRGRPFRKGLVPLGPGMTAGAAVVFLCLNFGVALAGDRTPAVTAAPLPPAPAAGDAPKGMALPATELVPGFAALPGELARREVSLEQSEAVPFRALVRRLSSLTGVTMAIEERPARVAGGTAILADPPPLRLAWRGTLAGLLDRVAALSGYDWSWTGGAVVFHRYWDVEQRSPAASAAGTAEAGTDADGTAGRAAAEESWIVDPAGHETLRGVLESWAARAGWTLVWKAGHDYGLGAEAVFRGGFLEATDLLLSGPVTRRSLEARAYMANRHLVVVDAGGAGS